jgi:hypothetical protein
MKRTLHEDFIARVSAPLRPAHEKFLNRYPGFSAERQPIHTYYVGAHDFQADTASRAGALALQSLDNYASEFITFAKAVGITGADGLADPIHARGLSETIDADPQKSRRENPAAWLAHTVYSRMRERLTRKPIEDLRIDFEDGYGNRPDAEEDEHAVHAANEIAGTIESRVLPQSIGIRIKPFTEELRERSIRTLDIFLSKLVAETRGKLPSHFYINLAKATVPEEVAALAALCDQLEAELPLPKGTLRIEIMIETAQAILNDRGEANLLTLVSAGNGRCVAAHFGTYDYTAGRNIAAAYQHMLHPACDFAREVMQVSLAGTGVWLSDGGTNILPVAPHSAPNGNSKLEAENREAIYRAWRLHFIHVRHSLVNGFYQGWDLHPAQLPTRYAAVYSFFLESFAPAAERLRVFVEKATQGAIAGAVADDAATGQALLNYVRRALQCGAVTEEEAQAATGLTVDELRMPSIAKILAARLA